MGISLVPRLLHHPVHAAYGANGQEGAVILCEGRNTIEAGCLKCRTTGPSKVPHNLAIAHMQTVASWG